MTREEAIKRLESIDIRDALQEDYDALDMAIQTLESIDKIKAEIKQLPYQRIFGKVSSYSLLDVVVEIIDKHIGDTE